MSSIGASGKRFWHWFMTPPSPTILRKRVAWSLWFTPPIMLFPMLLPIVEPSSIPGVLTKYWPLYLLFFGVPFALGVCRWHWGNRASSDKT